MGKRINVPSLLGGIGVADIFFVALIIVFFAVAAAFARGCEKIEKEQADD